MDKEHSSKSRPIMADRHTLGVIAESLFVVLPLIVLTIVLLYEGKSLRELLASPEWSFGTAIFMGQGLVKLVSGLSQARSLIWEKVAIVVSAFIVLGLAPSLIILALVLTTNSPSLILIVTQLVLFVLALLVFVSFGRLGNYLLSGR